MIRFIVVSPMVVSWLVVDLEAVKGVLRANFNDIFSLSHDNKHEKVGRTLFVKIEFDNFSWTYALSNILSYDVIRLSKNYKLWLYF